VSVRGVELYLWRNIVLRAADDFLPFARALDERGQAKVPDFDVLVHVKEDIAKLYVVVYDLVGAHAVAGTDKSSYEKPDLWLCETDEVEHVHTRATRTKHKNRVDVLFILETNYEPNDVGMV
jgi:hypothetical protein